MGDLKPIGSEKLQGQDKLKRIMEIARFNETIPSRINETAKSEYSKTLSDGSNYEIIRERQGYIIKKTISESETEYIEPMKNRKYYSSYSQALKRLNLVAGEVNRINENEEETSMFGEQKKFTLKTPKPAPMDTVAPPPMAPPIAPPPVPSPELPPSPLGDEEMDMGMEDMDMGPEGDVEMDTDIEMKTDGDMGGDKEQVTFKTIQKLTGKLTQKIRTLDTDQGMTSEDMKYVINMVLSSFDLNELSEEDREDILSKFEDESEDLGGDDMDGLDMTDDSEVEDIQADMDVPVEGYEMEEGGYYGEEMEDIGYYEEEMEEEGYGNGAIIDSIFGESTVDKVISKYFEMSKKEILESKEKHSQKKRSEISQLKKQMGEVVRLSETIKQELSAKKFLKENTTAKVVGLTNKKNLVFENKGKQVKISTEGLLV